MSSAHPLLQLLIARPELFAEHAAAYAELASEEGWTLLRRWQRQWRWRLLGFVAIAIGLLLAGQALMLWLLFKPVGQTLLALLLVPALPMVLGLLGLQAAKPASAGDRAFALLQRQLSADLTLLRANAGAPAGEPA
jgi:hypothetical protein